MTSRNLNDQDLVDLHWHGSPAQGEVLAEIKRTSSARDVREALLSLCYAVQRQGPAARGLCVIIDSRLSHQRLEAELASFKSIVRPDLASSVFLATQGPDGVLQGQMPLYDPSLTSALRDAIQRERSPGTGRVTRQQVVAALVERWLNGLSGQSMAEVRRQMDVSHQTVGAALGELQKLGAAEPERDGLIRLRPMSVGALRRIAEEHAAARKVIRFTDPSGHARLPSQMASRLFDLQQKSVGAHAAVGGVVGATRHFRDLNITAAPRLDISVYDADTRFVTKLDAGLVNDPKLSGKTPLVLHLQRDCRPQEVIAAAPGTAARLDCLADLVEIGLEAEADEFAHELIQAARKAR
jgi:DNA-binding transcriptional ArsR family regulator